MKFKLSNEELDKLSRAYLELQNDEYPTFESYLKKYISDREQEIKDVYDKHMKGDVNEKE